MTAATLEPPPLAAWWSEGKCLAHAPYPTRQVAEREAALHPSRFLSCQKCRDGARIAAFACPSEATTHYHIGHRFPEEETMSPAPTPIDLKAAPLRAGDTWVAVSAKGQGQPVTINRVTAVNVQYRAIGRGADASRTHSMPIPLFLARHAPIGAAIARKRQLEIAERAGKPELYEGRPVAEAARALVEEVPAAPESPDAEAAATESPEPSKQFGGRRERKLTPEQVLEIYQMATGGAESLSAVGRAYGVAQWTVSQIVKGITYREITADLRAARPTGGEAPRPSGPKPKLTDEQAREICLAAGTGPLSQVRAEQLGAHYGVHFVTIYSIVAGRAYAWATADLRTPPAPKETAMQTPTPPTVIETPSELEVERQRIKAEFQQREAEKRQSMQTPAETPAALARPDLSMLGTPARAESNGSALVADLADALELLLGTLDMPLPKFVTLDIAAIRLLVERARKAS